LNKEIRIVSEQRSAFPVTIALSAHWHTYPDRFHWIAEQGFALEYSPNPEAFETLPQHLDPFFNADVPIRYHGFFPRYEFGHHDSDLAERAMRVHFTALEALQGRGEQVITFHVGLNQNIQIEPGRVVENLSKLVEHARNLGITVCLENLRRGLTSHPETVARWARESGAMITLDVGHATSNQYVQNGELSVLDFIDILADRLVEVHMYERESDRHYAPKDMTVLGPIVDCLLTTQCTWWTIELDDCTEALKTRALLLDHLQTQQGKKLRS
jgi:sugar phosphate isomerase/epimerase